MWTLSNVQECQTRVHNCEYIIVFCFIVISNKLKVTGKSCILIEQELQIENISFFFSFFVRRFKVGTAFCRITAFWPTVLASFMEWILLYDTRIILYWWYYFEHMIHVSMSKISYMCWALSIRTRGGGTEVVHTDITSLAVVIAYASDDWVQGDSL